ncbi:hypothetical protein TSUD_374250 [Trifolium subterraneum]|uniref:Uncharacterized protein n=1 Tax=Trifolium subterraneum TaxID=3900 RepID=A0A2Z6PL45_TRISU|nr:hypothetical protein TSUD_374250 [Trifolium subterraneum]
MSSLGLLWACELIIPPLESIVEPALMCGKGCGTGTILDIEIELMLQELLAKRLEVLQPKSMKHGL